MLTIVKTPPNLGQFSTPHEGEEIVYWEDPRSLLWLTRSFANKAFNRIVRFYEPQQDKFSCGPASLAIVLNALRVGRCENLPTDPMHEEFARKNAAQLPEDYQVTFCKFTQRNIFAADPEQSLEQIYQGSYGLNLEKCRQLLLANSVSAETRLVNNEDHSEEAANICQVLSSDDFYIIANFDRKVWGLDGGGHISPIAAYDPISGKALIVDVNPCGRWLWIDIDLLLKSMATHDGDSQRGYLIATNR